MNRIERQLGQGIKRKRKTTKEQDDFINESEYRNYLNISQIEMVFAIMKYRLHDFNPQTNQQKNS